MCVALERVGESPLLLAFDAARFALQQAEVKHQEDSTRPDRLGRRAERRSLADVRAIAIDEFAVRKGHRYATVVVDLGSGRVLFCAEGKDHTCLKPFFEKLKAARAPLEAIAVDMSSAYTKAIEEYAPEGVKVVFDRYHVVARMNDALDKLRRSEQKRLEDEGKKSLKGARYLLLWGKEKVEGMDEKKQERLASLLAANETLHKAYLLKEDLRLFWQQADRAAAEEFIKNWISDARSVGVAELNTVADTISKHQERILAWYDHPITTGPLEGLNNKIKVLKRRAYGYRDMAFFLLRVLFIHETGFRLAGA